MPDMKTENNTNTPGFKHYTLGLAFACLHPANLSKSAHVLLVHKRAGWQAGKLNGIGGELQALETPHECMVREFKKACGFDTTRWTPFGSLNYKEAKVHLFTTVLPEEFLRSSMSDPDRALLWFCADTQVSMISGRKDLMGDIPMLIKAAHIALEMQERNRKYEIYIALTT